jgi:hypothetical protein
LAVLAATVTLAATDASAECSKRELRAHESMTVELEPITQTREHPAFYLRSPAAEVVFFFKPENMIAALETLEGKPPNVLQRIRANLPLREHTDLFKYVLADNSALAPLDFAMARLLESGRASVDFLPLHGAGGGDLGNDPKEIKLVYWSKKYAIGRKFCLLNGLELFSVLDEIE